MLMFPTDRINPKPNLFASWIVNQLLIASMKRLTSIHWVQDNFVSNNNLKERIFC